MIFGKWSFYSIHKYLKKEASVSTESFTTLWHQWDLSLGKISDRNSFIQFFCKFLAHSRKFSKTVITFEERHNGTKSFRVFLVSLDPIYEQNMSPNDAYHLGMFPRKCLFLFQINCRLRSKFYRFDWIP